MQHRFGLTTSHFQELRDKKYLYIDKTQFLYNLIMLEVRSFLARPRRFGKSLLVSTLESILRGEKELFDGLWISKSDYQWEKFGVIKLNFSSFKHEDVVQLEKELILALEKYATLYDIVIPNKVYEANSPSAVLSNLCEQLYKKYGQVALLVDEYDHPILHSLGQPEKAEKILSTLRDFFTTVKSLDTQIKFFFATGVSAFARAGIFSGMNNVRILSMEKEYATICGYTEQEIDTYFTPYIQEWAAKENIAVHQVRENIKKWYNGYHFRKEAEAVYNPFSLMHALEKKDLRNFWFESGNPSFLIKELERRQQEGKSIALTSDTIKASETSLGTFKIESMHLESLLFQTGYLTIAGILPSGFCKLDYPNYEVQSSFQTLLLSVIGSIDPMQAEEGTKLMKLALDAQDVPEFVALLKILFAQVPYHLHISKESFYHALLQITLGAAGFKAQSEYATSQGRIDLVVETQNTVYIIEVKLDSSADSALAQIKERKYYERFLHNKKQIILIGLSFQREPGKFDILWATESI